MAEIITMPKMSDTMTIGTLVAWHKKVGDSVKSGDILADVQTDKATMELESYYDGVLLFAAPEGSEIAVDALLAIIGKAGEDVSGIVNNQKTETSSVAKTVETVVEVKQNTPATNTVQTVDNEDDGRVKASPLAKKIAEENNIDLKKIKGTGDGGRIIKKDIEQVVDNKTVETKTSQVIPSVSSDSYTDFPLSNMRKTIARRLTESKNNAPHFYLTMSIDMEQAMAARKKLNELSPDNKISFNDLVIKAVSVSLKKHPAVNSSWLDDKIRQNHNINIGVAVAIEEGLVVPVIKNADKKGLIEISNEVKNYAAKAKGKGLHPDDYTGNTFTISNLGMFGIDEFTAIINPPDACILAVGAIQEIPVVKNGAVVPGNIMKVTLSCDHRAVDGAVGSAFLQTFKQLMEDPIRILL